MKTEQRNAILDEMIDENFALDVCDRILTGQTYEFVIAWNMKSDTYDLYLYGSNAIGFKYLFYSFKSVEDALHDMNIATKATGINFIQKQSEKQGQ